MAPLGRPVEDAVAHVLAGVSVLNLHPDVAEGVQALGGRGLLLVTLTKGSRRIAERPLSSARIRGEFGMLISVADPGAWKPAPAAYPHPARRGGVDPAQMLLVAVPSGVLLHAAHPHIPNNLTRHI